MPFQNILINSGWIEYDDKNYNDVLRKYVKIALGKELISFSRAASILNVSLKEVREL